MVYSMTDVATVWKQALPGIRQSVTGVGIWTALNTCVPILMEGDTMILGLPHEAGELAGHLRMHSTKMLIERLLSEQIAQKVQVRVIDGITEEDWNTAKRRDTERARLQEQSANRTRAEIQARSSWETIYDQISRAYAAMPNKSLPQNRAAFFRDAVQIIVEGLMTHPVDDDLSERNYARCLERIAQYCELPSVYVALRVMEASTQ